jgi:hypothetical protein
MRLPRSIAFNFGKRDVFFHSNAQDSSDE